MIIVGNPQLITLRLISTDESNPSVNSCGLPTMDYD